jgi:hypothetical protein
MATAIATWTEDANKLDRQSDAGKAKIENINIPPDPDSKTLKTSGLTAVPMNGDKVVDLGLYQAQDFVTRAAKRKGRSERTSSYQPEPERILRAHFTEQILSDLNKIQSYCGQPTAAVYANNLLHTIRLLRDQSPFDGYVEILMSLHDSMAFENRWLDYNESQYKGAYAVLKSYANQTLNNKKIQKAIVKLEKLGFETIPFGVDLDFFEEESTIDE